MGFWFENKLSGNPDPDKAFYLVHRLKPNLFITFVSGGVERAAGEEGGRGRRGGEERGGREEEGGAHNIVSLHISPIF
jgi:hypothetical protein